LYDIGVELPIFPSMLDVGGPTVADTEATEEG